VPSKESIDRVVAAALPEFEKSLRHALEHRSLAIRAFDLAKDAAGNTYSVIYRIVPANSVIGFVDLHELNTPAVNPPGEKQNGENTKDSQRST
jgi:hypothetical protein